MTTPKMVAAAISRRRIVRPPCPIDPACRMDHLADRRRKLRAGATR